MANQPLALESLVPESVDNGSARRDQQRLEDEVRSLRREVEDLTEDKTRLARTIENLRRNLSPLHTALRVIFGEIELAVGEEIAAASNGVQPSMAPAGDPRWESFKKQFPGVPAEIIDALLIHGDMRITNLAGLLKRHYNTIDSAATKLKNAGAVSRNQGTIALRR